MSNFLPQGNTLHKHRATLNKDKGVDTQTSSPWTEVYTDSSEASEAELLDATPSDIESADALLYDGRMLVAKSGLRDTKQRDRATSLMPSPAVERVPTTSPADERPSFRRVGTYRAQSPSLSALTAALREAKQMQGPQIARSMSALQAWPEPSQPSSSADDFSDLGSGVHTEDESSRSRSAPSHAAARPFSRLPAGPSQETGTPRPFLALPLAPLPRRRRIRARSQTRGRHAGVESEPEEGTLEVDSTFRDLLNATRTFMSFGGMSTAQSIPTKSVGPPLSTEDDTSSLSVNADIELPSSMSGSASSLQEKDNDVSKPIFDTPKASFWAWLDDLVHIKVWHCVTLCACVFGAGFAFATIWRPQRPLSFL